MALARARSDARKRDARHKIQLGGLIVKAGIDQEDSSVILGALVLAAAALQGSDAATVRMRFKTAGDRAFRDGNTHENESET